MKLEDIFVKEAICNISWGCNFVTDKEDNKLLDRWEMGESTESILT